MLHILLCGSYRWYKHNANTGAIRFKLLKFSLRYISRFVQQLQPIASFICFFKSNLQFCNKIGFPVGILSFPNICTDRSTASTNLVWNNGFSLFFQRLYEIYDWNSKIHGLRSQFTFWHIFTCIFHYSFSYRRKVICCEVCRVAASEVRQNHCEVLCFAQCEVKCAVHAVKHFTMRSITSRTKWTSRAVRHT